VLRTMPALHCGDIIFDVPLHDVGVFARCFLTTAPAGIPERIDVRRPEIKSSHVGIVVGTSFGTYNIRDGIDQSIVEGRSHGDGLRE
jgi:hypothetical protein